MYHLWTLTDTDLQRNFLFKDFTEAFGFLTRVAIVCEKMNHHPASIIVKYNDIKFHLSTHDAGDNVTDKDYELCQLIDNCAYMHPLSPNTMKPL